MSPGETLAAALSAAFEARIRGQKTACLHALSRFYVRAAYGVESMGRGEVAAFNFSHKGDSDAMLQAARDWDRHTASDYLESRGMGSMDEATWEGMDWADREALIGQARGVRGRMVEYAGGADGFARDAFSHYLRQIAGGSEWADVDHLAEWVAEQTGWGSVGDVRAFFAEYGIDDEAAECIIALHSIRGCVDLIDAALFDKEIRMVERVPGFTLQELAEEFGLGKVTLYVLRGRHDDFPEPAFVFGKKEVALYDREVMRAWLINRGTIAG